MAAVNLCRLDFEKRVDLAQRNGLLAQGGNRRVFGCADAQQGSIPQYGRSCFSGRVIMAPREGIEPPTKRLTAARSTAELPGILVSVEVVFHQESGRLSRS